MRCKHNIPENECPECCDRKTLDALTELPIKPWQNCWDDVGTAGVSLLNQFRQYKKTFGSWLALNQVKIIPKSKEKNLESGTRVNETLLARIAKATTVMELQNELIVLNANEFRLRDNPVREEFEAILLDYQKWELRESVDGNIYELVVRIVKTARTKFRELIKESEKVS